MKLLGLVCTLLLLLAVEVSAEPTVPSEAERGVPVIGSVEVTESWGSMTVELRDEDGVVLARTRTFPLGEVGRDGFVIGVPSTAEPGPHVLAFLPVGMERTVMTVPLVVRGRTFERQNVYLNEELSDLLGRPDPEKTEEARALSLLLQEFDPEAVFQTSPFVMPVRSLA